MNSKIRKNKIQVINLLSNGVSNIKKSLKKFGRDSEDSEEKEQEERIVKDKVYKMI